MPRRVDEPFEYDAWLRDIELQSASASTRGIWMNALCYMDKGKPRGRLSGTVTALQKILNCTTNEFRLFLEEAKLFKFADVHHSNDVVTLPGNAYVTLENRRMINKEKKRQLNKLRVRKYRDRDTGNASVQNHVTQKKRKRNAPAKPKARSEVPVQEIVDLYHRILPELPRCVALKAVAPAIEARWREHRDRRELSWWADYFENWIRPSDFLMGKKTDWACNLQWVVGPKNMGKVLNGTYVNHNGGPRPRTYAQHQDDERRAKARMVRELDSEKQEGDPKRIGPP